MTPDEIRAAARALPRDDVRRVRALNFLNDAARHARCGTEALALAERVLREAPDSADHPRGGWRVGA